MRTGELNEQPMFFIGVDQRQFGESGRVVITNAGQKGDEVAAHALDGGFIEEVGVELEDPQQALIVLPHVEHDVELCRRPLQIEA